MELKIIYKKTAELLPYARNARTHSDSQVAQLAASIKEFGFNNPVAIDADGMILCGHGRVMAAQRLGMDQVPTVCLAHLTDIQKKAYILADNKLALNAGWDNDMLKVELEDLKFSNFDLDLVGFSTEELDEIMNQNEEPEVEEDDYTVAVPEEPKAKLGEIYILGKHRLMCGDSTSIADVEKLMGEQQADLLLTDPPYNVDYEGGTDKKLKIKNDNMEDQAFRQFLIDVYKAADHVMKPGAPFYIWHADSEGANFRGAAKDMGWQIRECLIWVKNSLVLGRQDYQWRHEPCQPAGTKVLTVQGYKNIEDLTEQDRVISYSSYSGQVVGFKNGGYAIQTANRHYKGTLYGIEAAGKKTWCTNNHQFSVRFNSKVKKNYCTYLMKRGDWWRVGITKAYDARQFGLKTRLHQEKGEAVWLIGVYEDKIAAQVAEQILSVKYGIPYTVWEQDRFAVVHRSQDQISAIYAALDLKLMHENAIRLLHDFNRDENYPLITPENQCEKFSTRVTAKINACNLVPGLMQVPVPNEDPAVAPNFRWVEISDIDHKEHDGLVYSLAVEKFEHYVADGIITHNCLYGWKAGAAHYFTDSRAESTVIEDQVNVDKLSKDELKTLCKRLLEPSCETTVIHEKKPSINDVHPTMKPVKLFGRLVKNSSKRNDIVLDLFGGSGTTIVACEQLNRRAYLMELDPAYVDVIIDRYQKLTNVEVMRSDGKLWNDL